MPLILLIGDTLIPYKYAGMPAKFVGLLRPGKVDSILALGNVQRDERVWLSSLASSPGKAFFLLGDVDRMSSDVSFREEVVVECAGLKIGAVRCGLAGAEMTDAFLDAAARRLGVSVLAVGGKESNLRVEKREGAVVIAPGEGTRSFALLDVKDNGNVVIYGYTLCEDDETDVDIRKYEFEF